MLFISRIRSRRLELLASTRRRVLFLIERESLSLWEISILDHWSKFRSRRSFCMAPSWKSLDEDRGEPEDGGVGLRCVSSGCRSPRHSLQATTGQFESRIDLHSNNTTTSTTTTTTTTTMTTTLVVSFPYRSFLSLLQHVRSRSFPSSWCRRG